MVDDDQFTTPPPPLACLTAPPAAAATVAPSIDPQIGRSIAAAIDAVAWHENCMLSISDEIN